MRRIAAASIALFLSAHAYAADFVQAVETISPSIVTIVSSLSQHGGGQLNYISSGIIVSEEGLILTVHEAVAGFDNISVRTSDGLQRPAGIYASDRVSGLVILQIIADDLTPARLADSDALKVGQYVLSAGSQYGVEKNLAPGFSLGIIGGLNRYVPSVESHHRNLIKTDAAMSPGSLGGPLVNAAGEVVGVSIAICSNSGGWEGIGYAVPSNEVAAIVEKLKHGGLFDRGWLGVVIGTDEFLRHGTVEVLSVGEDTPAHKAGIREGDLIIAIDGRQVEDSFTLVDTIATTSPGTQCILTVERGNQQIDVTVTIGNRPTNPHTEVAGQRHEPYRLPEETLEQIEEVGEKLADAIRRYVDELKDPDLAETHRQVLQRLTNINFKVISGSELQQMHEENRRLRQRVEQLERQLGE